jgi:hypothetical protein
MTKINHLSHGMGDHVTGHAVKGNIARDGAPKKVTGIAVHPGMTRQQQDGAGVGGMGHAAATISGGQTIASSAAAAPLAHSYGAAPDLKTGKVVPPSFGQRSRTNEDTESHADKVQAGRDTLASAARNK